MWSRKKRKKEGKGNGGSSGKAKLSQQQQHHHHQQRQQHSRPASISPAVVRKETSIIGPLEHSMETKVVEDICRHQLHTTESVRSPDLSVPLPSSPLAANILDSLDASAVDRMRGESLLQQSATVGGLPQSAVNSTTEQLKQVIEEAKRTIMTQISQQLASSVVASRHTIPTISSRVTQTFDYGNQTNKDLEQVAAEQREEGYLETERWRCN